VAIKMNAKRTTVEKQVVMRIRVEGNIIIIGSVYIDEFNRFSDFVEHNEHNIKVCDGTIDGNQFDFIIILKKKMLL
jgi:hypothetical protein